MRGTSADDDSAENKDVEESIKDNPSGGTRNRKDEYNFVCK